MTTLEVTESIRAELMDAIAPCVQDLCMLDYQRWQYKFMPLPAHSDSFLHDFDPAEAEGMFTEKTGKIGASLFPQLARWETGDTEVRSAADTLSNSSLIWCIAFYSLCSLQG